MVKALVAAAAGVEGRSQVVLAVEEGEDTSGFCFYSQDHL